MHRGRRSIPAHGFTYQPALDGVRAVAVVLVLQFHAGFGWMPGGYVGVSVFFTLSGFLITSLALAEHERTGHFRAGEFYARRIRRLLPASLLCIGGVSVAAWLHQFDGVTEIRRDLWAALAQVYNWVLLANGDSYGAQMAKAAGQRAPLDHYWSLAIEEQFYWVWPLVLLAVLRWTPGRRVLAVTSSWAAMVVVAVVLAVVAGGSTSYLATPARLPEILAGAVLAVCVRRRSLPPWSWLGALCGLAVVVVVAVTWPAAGGPAEAGWLPLLAVASTGLIAGLQVGSPLRTVLGVAPLAWLGRISYGVYLFHWPVYTLVDERRLAIGQWPLFAVRLAITLAIATASYYAVEMPVRTRRLAWRPTLAGAVAGCVALAAIVVAAPDRDGDYTYVADATRRAAAIVPFATDESHDLGGRPVRVLVIGDSTAVATGEGLIQWSAEHPDVMRVTSRAAVGCGVDPVAVPVDDFHDVCREVIDGHYRAVGELEPDVVVAMVTFRDMEDREWTAAEGLLTPTDRRFRRHLLAGYELATTRLLGAGAGLVMFVIPPTPGLPAVGDIAPMLDPERIEAYRQVVRSMPLSFPDEVVVADLASWFGADPDPPARKDGLHWTLDGAVEVADEFLVPEILSALDPSVSG